MCLPGDQSRLTTVAAGLRQSFAFAIHWFANWDQRGEQSATAPNAIEIRIEDISQLFDTLDPFPFPERDLDRHAEEFIVGWATELPADRPLRIVVHLPEAQASTPGAHELGAALTRFFGYRAQVIALDLNELFRVGRRALAIGLTVLSFCIIVGQTAAAHLAPRPIARRRKLDYLRMGRQGDPSRYFCMTGGQSFANAICTDDCRPRNWSCGRTK